MSIQNATKTPSKKGNPKLSQVQSDKQDLSVFPINVKTLAAALVKNAESGAGKINRHKGFLDLIAQSQGFNDYRAMTAAMRSSESLHEAPTAPEARPTLIDATWVYFSNGAIHEKSCKIGSRYHSVLFEQDECSGDTASQDIQINWEYLLVNGEKRLLIRNPINPKDAFALACAEHFSEAASEQLEMIQSESVWRIEGRLSEYGLNGDWFENLSQGFELDFENLENAINGSPGPSDRFAPSETANEILWHAECYEGFKMYEYFIDAADILFTDPNTEYEKKFLSIPTKNLFVHSV